MSDTRGTHDNNDNHDGHDGDDNVPPYEYQPLPHDAIRLIELELASRTEAPLRCRLITESLDSVPTYDALSYAWNGETPQMPLIHHDGKRRMLLLLTPNADAALRRYRAEAARRRLLLPSRRVSMRIWVDSICISQADVNERNHQVSMMTRVYESARWVIIWLGHGNPVSARAMAYFRRCSRFAAAVRTLRLHRIPKLGPVLQKRGTWLLFYRCPDPVISDISMRGYWKRVWTLQEFAAKRDVLLFCGDVKPVVRPCDALDSLVYQRPHTLSLEGLELHVDCLQYREDEEGDVEDLLTTIMLKDATEPRDKIFALRGLMPYVLGDIEVDYERPLDELFREATAKVILNDKDLDMLYHTHLRSGHPALDKLPSWSVDFNTTTRGIFGFDKDTNGFTATNDAGPRYSFDKGMTQLTLTGKLVDEIAPLISENIPRICHSMSAVELDTTDALWDQRKDDERTFCRILAGFAAELRAHDGAAAGARNPNRARPAGLMRSFEAMCEECYLIGVSGIKSLAPHAHGLSVVSLWLGLQDLFPVYRRELRGSKLKAVEDLSYEFFMEMESQTLFATKDGRVGRAYGKIQPGDAIGLFAGLTCPFVVRPVGEGKFALIGPAAVSDMVRGELFPDDDEDMDASDEIEFYDFV